MGSVQFAINGHEDLEVGISLLVRAAVEALAQGYADNDFTVVEKVMKKNNEED